MINTLENLEKEILEYCYYTILKSKDYFHNFTIEELKEDKKFSTINENELLYWIEQLGTANLISIRSLPRRFDFRMTLDGLIYIEKFFMKNQQNFISFTLDALKFLREVENEKIELYPGKGSQVGSYPILAFLDSIGSPEESELQKLKFVINELSGGIHQKGESFVYWNSFGFAGQKLVFFRTLLLTPKGRAFLNYHLKLKNLFTSIDDEFGKEVLLDEYNEIENLRKRERWKDSFIKMGMILEYLITDYIERHKLEKDKTGERRKVEISISGKKKKSLYLDQASFGEKILFIIQYDVFGRDNNNDWVIVESLIRNYRNYIHLQKYIREKVRINKDIFDTFYPVFEKLILLF